MGLLVVITPPALKGTNLRGPKNPILWEKKFPSLKACKKILQDNSWGKICEKIIFLAKKPQFRVFLGSNGHFLVVIATFFSLIIYFSLFFITSEGRNGCFRWKNGHLTPKTLLRQILWFSKVWKNVLCFTLELHIFSGCVLGQCCLLKKKWKWLA